MGTRWPRPLTWALSALLLVGLAEASILVQAPSTLTTRVMDPPVQLIKGGSADEKRYFKSFELSQNQTSFTAEVKPRGGADMKVSDVLRLDNQRSSAAPVTLTASQVSNSNVEDFEWHIHNGSSHVATLDYLSASPSASFSLPAGQTFTMDLKVDLADGAGRDNAGISFDLQLEVT